MSDGVEEGLIDAQTVALTALRQCVSQMVPDQILRSYRVRTDYRLFSDMARGMVVHIERDVWGKSLYETEIRYPATWWDAFIERWFPAWLKRRYPPKFAVWSASVYDVYPSVRILGEDPQRRASVWRME